MEFIFVHGIRGYYYTRGRGLSTTRYIYWNQDGHKIVLDILGNVLPQQQLIKIANPRLMKRQL